MHKFYQDDQEFSRSIYVGRPRKRYGFFSFLFDCVMTLVTGGLWLIWVFVREMRGRRYH